MGGRAAALLHATNNLLTAVHRAAGCLAPMSKDKINNMPHVHYPCKSNGWGVLEACCKGTNAEVISNPLLELHSCPERSEFWRHSLKTIISIVLLEQFNNIPPPDLGYVPVLFIPARE
jgi:hypothetical protein